MKFGLIVYKNSPNLGDDIQSYAVRKLLPQVDYYIEREALDTFLPETLEKVAVIVSGWYLYSHLNWPPSLFIAPLVTSIHFDTYYSCCLDSNILKNFILDGYGGEWLKSNGPIGCRDGDTKKMLDDFDIPNYFSGCATLTLPRFDNVAATDKIIAVDISEKALEALKEKTSLPIETYTHYIELSEYGYDTRFDMVEERLKAYQSARLVITTRLHAALPCLALGVPVLFIKEDWALNRTGTWLEYLNYMDVSAFECGNFDEHYLLGITNPRKHLPLKAALLKQCADFIERAKTQNEALDAQQIIDDEQKRLERLKTLMILRSDRFMRKIDKLSPAGGAEHGGE